MLRNRKLAAPGPEVFLALGSDNQWLGRHRRWGQADSEAPPLKPELIEALPQWLSLPLRDN